VVHVVTTGATVVGFIPTRDVARARAFYVDVLGLRLLAEDGFACVVDAGGATVRVTLVPDYEPGDYTVLGWAVPDVTAAVRALVSKGIEFARFTGMDQDDDGVWTSPGGDRVAWFRDEDGNVLSLTQSGQPRVR
jgi:catechol 2,3-dioxygenase-like lactoylglutathione lyase family enzyme